MKVIMRTTPKGRKIMIKFGYADASGECYSRFADASYANFGRGASYAAFVASAEPDTLHCFEWDTYPDLKDRALTPAEKAEFKKNYLAQFEG